MPSITFIVGSSSDLILPSTTFFVGTSLCIVGIGIVCFVFSIKQFIILS